MAGAYYDSNMLSNSSSALMHHLWLPKLRGRRNARVKSVHFLQSENVDHAVLVSEQEMAAVGTELQLLTHLGKWCGGDLYLSKQPSGSIPNSN